MEASLRLGRLFGIPLELSYTWFFVFAMVTLSLAMYYFPTHYPLWSPATYWLVGLATSVLFFASVVAHELAHSLVARASGIPVRSITLFIFGGVASIAREARKPADELVMALVGPLMSVALAAFFGALWLLTRGISQPLAALARYLGWINLSLALFNLIPGFPLDGGRVLRSLLWAWHGDFRQATRIVSLAGQGLAYLFILTGIWQIFKGNWSGGLWIAFIGWFLDNAAQTSYRQVALRSLLDGHTVREVMTRECYPLPPEITLEKVINEYLLGTGRRCFPVVDQGHLRGLMTLHNIKRIPREHWPVTTVEVAMTPLAELRAIGPDVELWSALQEMTEEGVNQLPVVEEGQLLGMLGRDNILTFLRTKAELGL